jgi:gamma-glutamyltranspeptidase
MQITADERSGERSSVAIKNTSQKAITQYQLACFKIAAGKAAVDWRFKPASRVIETGESTHYSVSDKSPMEVCRTRNSRLGIESVIFQDGTTWSSGE